MGNPDAPSEWVEKAVVSTKKILDAIPKEDQWIACVSMVQTILIRWKHWERVLAEVSYLMIKFELYENEEEDED